jgi:hypothetical protein
LAKLSISPKDKISFLSLYKGYSTTIFNQYFKGDSAYRLNIGNDGLMFFTRPTAPGNGIIIGSKKGQLGDPGIIAINATVDQFKTDVFSGSVYGTSDGKIRLAL